MVHFTSLEHFLFSVLIFDQDDILPYEHTMHSLMDKPSHI